MAEKPLASAQRISSSPFRMTLSDGSPGATWKL